MLDLSAQVAPRECDRCRTELAPSALACPSCAALVHRARLTQLADQASAAAAAGDRVRARAHWLETLALLPPDSEQHRIVSARAAELASEPHAAPPSDQHERASGAWWKQGVGGVVALSLLLGSKLKFLLLGLTKISTLTSMFGFIVVYWSLHGWPLAIGLAGSIYIHEMGHVAMLRRLGIKAGAPLFIPGVGALVMLKERVTDPIADARIGLAGPVWGLGAAIAAWAAFLLTGAPIWRALAELTGFLNLFNLIPVWQLDGSRGFHALSRQQRWTVTAAIGAVLWLTGVRLLWLVGGVAAFRASRTDPGPGDQSTTYTFVVLVAALAWFAMSMP